MYIERELSIGDLPEQCVEECSQPGPCDEAVAYWRERLDFWVNRERAIECLAGYGAWTRDELAREDNVALAERVLWLACGAFSEWDGTSESACGSDIFVLE